jgi:hypothetical protein
VHRIPCADYTYATVRIRRRGSRRTGFSGTGCYQMAWNHGLSRAVPRVYTRVLLDVYRRGARARDIDGGQTGRVTACSVLAGR